jgi:hypothetical protein
MRVLITILSLVFIVFVCTNSLTLAARGSYPKDKEFNSFYKKLKRAVNSNDKAAILDLMAEDFQWACDGRVSRQEALRLMGQYKKWQVFKNAVKGRIFPNVDSECQERQCYSVWSKTQPPEGFIFRYSNGIWKWSEFRAD